MADPGPVHLGALGVYVQVCVSLYFPLHSLIFSTLQIYQVFKHGIEQLSQQYNP